MLEFPSLKLQASTEASCLCFGFPFSCFVFLYLHSTWYPHFFWLGAVWSFLLWFWIALSKVWIRWHRFSLVFYLLANKKWLLQPKKLGFTHVEIVNKRDKDRERQRGRDFLFIFLCQSWIQFHSNFSLEKNNKKIEGKNYFYIFSILFYFIFI